MSLTPRLRLAACVVVALAATALAVARVAPLGPSLDVQVIHSFHLEGQDIYDVRIVPRGGETIDTVRVEALRGDLRVSPPVSTHGLAPDTRFQVRVNVAADTAVPAAVRIHQEGRVGRIYDVELAEVAE